jgi:hypothetical protein
MDTHFHRLQAQHAVLMFQNSQSADTNFRCRRKKANGNNLLSISCDEQVLCYSGFTSLWQTTWHREFKETIILFVHRFRGFSPPFCRNHGGPEQLIPWQTGNSRAVRGRGKGVKPRGYPYLVTYFLHPDWPHILQFYHLAMVYSNFVSNNGLNHSLIRTLMMCLTDTPRGELY